MNKNAVLCDTSRHLLKIIHPLLCDDECSPVYFPLHSENVEQPHARSVGSVVASHETVSVCGGCRVFGPYGSAAENRKRRS